MTGKLIHLDDGILVEVESVPGDVEFLSAREAHTVAAGMEHIVPLLKKVCSPLAKAWKELNKDFLIEQAEVELGLSFEGEGNIYIAQAKAGANINIKLTLKPKGG